MNNRLKKYLMRLAKKIPSLARYFKLRKVRERYPVETALIKGAHQNDNQHPSIIHFTVNKCATQYVNTILKTCALENNMTPAYIYQYAFCSNFPYFHELSAKEMRKYKHVFKPEGYLYSVFNNMIEGIPNLDKFKVVLMLRDPRDLLVSEYYSYAFSHAIPNKYLNKHSEVVEVRALAQALGLDKYVLHASMLLNQRLKRYQSLLIDKYPHIYRTRYEDMTANFAGWLDNLLQACNLTIDKATRAALIQNHEASKPKTENIRHHLRKGRPGDYKEKLHADTIDQLNETFAWFLTPNNSTTKQNV